MPGEPDPLYVLARKVLLDALEALGEQRPAITLVGAQAIYHHVGESDIAVAPHTEDADLALAPELLLKAPALAEAMAAAGFQTEPGKVGIWKSREGATVDLLVADAVGGEGRRGARLPEPHGKKVARKVHGLEAAMVDKAPASIHSLDDDDDRSFLIDIAGPAALLVAKLIKLAERVNEKRQGRLRDKDALDIFRILQGTETVPLAAALGRLDRHGLAGEVTRESLSYLQSLFGSETSDGTRMLLRSTEGLVDPDILAASCQALALDLVDAMSSA